MIYKFIIFLMLEHRARLLRNDKKWRYVCAALLGFAEEQQIQQIPLIEFIKMPENQVTYTIQHDKKE